METSAELLYLLKHFDSNYVFGFQDELEHSQCLQRLFFWHGSGAPIQGQLVFFGKKADKKDEFAIQRFKKEVLRVFGVLEIHLSGEYTGDVREYLAGNGRGKYSIADIGTWPWVGGWGFSVSLFLSIFLRGALADVQGQIKEEDMEEFPHLKRWIARIAERPAVKKGTAEKWQIWQGSSDGIKKPHTLGIFH